MKTSHTLPKILLCLAGFSLASRVFAVAPVWDGSAGSTRAIYNFTTSSATPAPNSFSNPNGGYNAVVTFVAPFGTGWQDPAGLFTFPGAPPAKDGAWDLGFNGTIIVTFPAVPAAAPPGSFYHVDFQVYSVSYKNPTALPSLVTQNITPVGVNMTTATVATDILSSTWDSQTWTGTFDTSSGGNIAFGLTAPNNNTSTVDTLEVYTRYTLVPEPSAFLVLFITAMGLTLRRKRGPGMA